MNKITMYIDKFYPGWQFSSTKKKTRITFLWQAIFNSIFVYFLIKISPSFRKLKVRSSTSDIIVKRAIYSTKHPKLHKSNIILSVFFLYNLSDIIRFPWKRFPWKRSWIYSFKFLQQQQKGTILTWIFTMLFGAQNRGGQRTIWYYWLRHSVNGILNRSGYLPIPFSTNQLILSNVNIWKVKITPLKCS